jgi:hypothetical protein
VHVSFAFAVRHRAEEAYFSMASSDPAQAEQNPPAAGPAEEEAESPAGIVAVRFLADKVVRSY